MVIVFRRFLQGTQSEKKNTLVGNKFYITATLFLYEVIKIQRMLTLRNIQISVVSLLIFGQTVPQRHSLEAGKFLELYFFLFVVRDNNI